MFLMNVVGLEPDGVCNGGTIIELLIDSGKREHKTIIMVILVGVVKGLECLVFPC